MITLSLAGVALAAPAVAEPGSPGPAALPAPGYGESSNPLVSNDPEQPDGDWERFPTAVHVPLGLGPMFPFGSIDSRDTTSLADNAGTYTSFEIGVGLRVRRVLGGLVFAIGGAGLEGPTRTAIESLGYDPGSALRIFAGLDGAYYLARTESWAPWVGGRFGYEALVYSGSLGDNQHLSYSFGGVYFAARGGADWRTAPAFGIGAYGELGLGRTLSGTASVSLDDDPITPENEHRSTEDDIDLEGSAFHGFVGAGIRIVFFP